MVMIYALGGVSGGNFNPAVSLALGVTKKMSWKKVGLYMVVQLLGGLFAGLTYRWLYGFAFQLGPAVGHTLMQAGVAEMIYTFMLCFVVLNVACSERDGGGKNQYYGLAIGFVIVAGAYSGGPISGGCFNPAVAFGINFARVTGGVCTSSFIPTTATIAAGLSCSTDLPEGGSEGWTNFFTYALFEFVGAALAAVIFWVVRPDEPDAPFKTGKMVNNNYPLVSKLVSEFLGTFMLVLTVGLNCGNTATVFSIASSLMCMIFALGSVSGAHFNPAVTTAVVVSGRKKCSPKEGGMYVAVQILAGICASFIFSALNVSTTTLRLASNPDSKQYFGLPQTHDDILVGFGEFFFTFVLAFVVLSVATVQTPLSEYFGLAIGMCVTTGALAIGSITGGSLNPAVTVGLLTNPLIFGYSPGKLSSGACWLQLFLYCVVELAAGAAAAGLFKLTHRDEYKTSASAYVDIEEDESGSDDSEA